MTFRRTTFLIRIFLFAVVAALTALNAERKGGPQSIPRYEKNKFFSLGDLFKGSSGEEKETPDGTDPEHLEEIPGNADSAGLAKETITEITVAAPGSLSLLVAVIRPTSGNDADGVIYFEKMEKGVEVSGRITGLLPGIYDLGVHGDGDLSAADGMSAGASFNPEPQSNGSKKKSGPVGSLGRIVANRDGVAGFSFIDRDLSVEGAESIVGRGLVIHRDSMDLTSGKTEAENLRVGMAVIGIADPNAKRL